MKRERGIVLCILKLNEKLEGHLWSKSPRCKPERFFLVRNEAESRMLPVFAISLHKRVEDLRWETPPPFPFQALHYQNRLFFLVLGTLSLCEGGFCPPTHPFAFLDGKKCCAAAMEDGYKGKVETCNAGYLDLRSTCCAFGLDIPCQQEPCHHYSSWE